MKQLLTHLSAAALGALLAVVFLPSPAPPGVLAPDAPVPVPEAPGPPSATPHRAPDTCPDTLASCQDQLAFATRLLDADEAGHTSITVPIPEHLQDRQNPDAARAAFQGWLEACGLDSPRLLSLDCDEYPCLGAVLFEHPDDAMAAMDCESHAGYRLAPGAFATLGADEEQGKRFVNVFGTLEEDDMFQGLGSKELMGRLSERAEVLAYDEADALGE